MRIYISGPITGVENYMENFQRAEEFLRDRYPWAKVVNPAKLNREMAKQFSHGELMKMSLSELSLCDTIYMIEGWENSAGANMEAGYAIAEGYKFIGGDCLK